MFIDYAVADAITLLIDCASASSSASQRETSLVIPALLTLHNLCFHAANKPKLLANGEHNYEVCCSWKVLNE